MVQFKKFLFLACLILTVANKIPNPYKVLGVVKTATQQQIKKAFKKRSLQYHPDKNKEDPKATQKFQKIVNAYQLLKDQKRRAIYDQTGQDQGEHPGYSRGSGGGFASMGMGMGGSRKSSGGGRSRTFTFSFGGGQGFNIQL